MSKKIVKYVKCKECGEVNFIPEQTRGLKCFYCDNFEWQDTNNETERRTEQKVREMIKTLLPSGTPMVEFPPSNICEGDVCPGWYDPFINTIFIPKKTLCLSRDEILNRLSEQKCISLSTGQKKLLQLFAIDLYQPKILILDEPFNGLDPTKRTLLANRIKEMRNQGGTILISTHILSDLQELADRITMIKRGKIVYSGLKTDDIQKLYEQYFVQNKKSDDLFA